MNTSQENLPDSPAKQEREQRPIIVAFGDSLTAGAGVEPSGNYPSRLQVKIDQAGYRYRVVNQGISGDTSAEGLSRISSAVALRPAIAIVELGANDGLRGLPVEAMRRNLGEIIDEFKSVGARVVLAGMKIPPDTGSSYASSFCGAFAALAKEKEILIIPFFLEGVGGQPAFNQEDGIHPNAEGYAIITENVWKVLKPML